MSRAGPFFVWGGAGRPGCSPRDPRPRPRGFHAPPPAPATPLSVQNTRTISGFVRVFWTLNEGWQVRWRDAFAYVPE